MSQQYTGLTLFTNDRKEPGSRQPDYNGKGTISPEVAEYIRNCPPGEQVELEVIGWKKTSQKGTTFLSLVVDIPWKIRKDQQQAPRAAGRQAKPDLQDDIPF